MEAIYSSELSIGIKQTIRRYILEYKTFRTEVGAIFPVALQPNFGPWPLP
jgi:hypothetical protein